jgi:hypothetical protein
VLVLVAASLGAAPGDVDTSFDPNADGTVSCIAVQANGKILLSGYFLNVAGARREHFARLNSDGTLDAGVNFVLFGTALSMAEQADGKILLGGDFTAVGGPEIICIARLF